MSGISKEEEKQIEAIFNAREGKEQWSSGETLKDEVNDNFESRLESMKERLKEVNKQTGFQARKVETDEQGHLLLDPNNPEDVEWYENDAAYDIIQNKFTTDQHGNMISKDRGTDIIY